MHKIFKFPRSPIYFFFCYLCIGDMAKKSYQVHCHQVFVLCFFLSILLFKILRLGVSFNFYKWCSAGAQLHSFICEHSMFPAPFVITLVVLASLPKITCPDLWKFISGLSTPLLCMCVFMPISHCFEIRTCESQFYSFSRLSWLFRVPWNSIGISEWIFLFVQKMS